MGERTTPRKNHPGWSRGGVLGRQQQPAGRSTVTRGGQTADGLLDLSGGKVPVGGSAEQVRDSVRSGGVQLAAERVAEQPVVAVPLTVGVERDDEQVGVLQLLEDGSRSLAAEYRVAQ